MQRANDGEIHTLSILACKLGSILVCIWGPPAPRPACARIPMGAGIPLAAPGRAPGCGRTGLVEGNAGADAGTCCGWGLEAGADVSGALSFVCMD